MLGTGMFLHYKRTKVMNIPLLPVCIQSTPSLEFFSLTCRDLIEARVSMGLRPEFCASAIGIESSASANDRIAYCSRPGLWSETWIRESLGWINRPVWRGPTLRAASSTASEQAISAAPPP